jgi:3-oxoacyl-[acyl-carrier protein] reductase
MLAKNGATLALADRNLAGTEETKAGVTALGGKALAIEVDVANSKSVDAMVDATVRSFGQLDTLVHCAAILKIVSIVDTSDEDWERIIDVNLNGSFYASRAAARVMVPRKSGRIILITSGHGARGGTRNGAYSASKGGVNALMLTLAREVGSYGIAVNAVNPGQTETPLMRSLPADLLSRTTNEDDPLKRIGKPEDVAELITFLAGDAGFITGQVMSLRLA